MTTLSEFEVMGLIVTAEFFIALAVIALVLNWVRKRDYKSLLHLYENQEALIEELRDKISHNNNPAQKKADEKLLAEMELLNAQHKREISRLETDLNFFKRRTNNLEVYQSLYKTLKTAISSNSHFQSNLNDQIRKSHGQESDINQVLKESDRNIRSMLELVNEQNLEPQEDESDSFDLDSVQENSEVDQGHLASMPPFNSMDGTDVSEHQGNSTEKSAEQLRAALYDQQNLVAELKDKLAQGDGQHLAEMQQLESLLNISYHESVELKQKLEQAKTSEVVADSLRSDLEMRKAKIKILQAEKENLKTERDDLEVQCKKLAEDNQSQYKKMVQLAKTLAKGGVLKKDKDAYSAKQALAKKEKEFEQLSEQYEMMRKEFVELESQYLKEIGRKNE